MTTIWSGLAVGSIYAMVAMAYNVGFVPSGVFNFAQAQGVTVAAFASYVLFVQLNLPTVFVFPLVLASGAVVSILQTQASIAPIPAARLHPIALVTTVGASFAIDGIVLVVWGPEPKGVNLFGQPHTLNLLGGLLDPVDLALVCVAVGCAILLELSATRTKWGLASLAAGEDRDAAELRGVNVKGLTTVAFAGAGLVTALVGFLSVTKTYAVFDLGDNYAIKAFVCLAFFGFGSQKGALAGGLLIGSVEALTARWFGSFYSDPAVFGLLLIVLMIRPAGAFGARGLRRV